MKLGLLGFPIAHSLSPELYKKILGAELESYTLFPYQTSADIPSLTFFAEKLNGLNITAPFKKHFLQDVIIEDDFVKELSAINTIAFYKGQYFATNTDYLAVVEILKNYVKKFTRIKIVLLGDGSMANLTLKACSQLQIPVQQYSRKLTPDFQSLDLRPLNDSEHQTIVVNSCSRDFVFQGTNAGTEIFWDYNYSFFPHENSLPGKFQAYHDGKEMLELQAREAVKFWKSYI